MVIDTTHSIFFFNLVRSVTTKGIFLQFCLSLCEAVFSIDYFGQYELKAVQNTKMFKYRFDCKIFLR